MPHPAAQALEQELVLGPSPSPFCSRKGRWVSVQNSRNEEILILDCELHPRLSQDSVSDLMPPKKRLDLPGLLGKFDYLEIKHKFKDGAKFQSKLK